ncbi:MAG TPA: DUF763 domain-containing protein [Syntrophorhabdaceae bacterium]|nr:DUF763 domain-containing protein [Syntrophorhabdaceae bacterium]HON84489.1 DUF763 domain-containing protein [Syntrophorhabdaceae bacterium]HPC65709.1 DUF763 domain-containing protein [Syntrophorhabdaceae bacterium]HQE79921.1 DUF763 domain-containing protein [Syntrophorhabdaceae bacterium]HQK45668.1 DUF763 domain-containing protein [Syntrophorhabdaceae bacterium]
MAIKRAITNLPLHYGKAPLWLFSRMKRFSAAIIEIILFEFGPKELLKRLSDPIWFQALGCAAGFDWHSSGVTTTLCGALKEGLLMLGDDAPVAICGGKAKRAIETPGEITVYGDRWGMDVSKFIELSKICAKIDNCAIQDGYNLYHHTFIFTKEGDWAVIQQGMNEANRTARRYQWLSKDGLNLTMEPHTGITCDKTDIVLNLVAEESSGTQTAIVDFSRQTPDKMVKIWTDMTISMPKRHYITERDFDTKRLGRIFKTIYEEEPANFEEIMKIKGVGPKTMAALSLVAELVYEKLPSFKDPARFSFAHGGKDGHPYPVDRKTYDKTIETLKTCVDKAKLKDREKLDALKRLAYLNRY